MVELTTAVQGPAAGQYLRDMGADVVKVRLGRVAVSDTAAPKYLSVNLEIKWSEGGAKRQHDVSSPAVKVERPTGDGNRHGRGTQNNTERVGLEPQFVSGLLALSQGLLHKSRGPRGGPSHRTPWHPVEDPSALAPGPLARQCDPPGC